MIREAAAGQPVLPVVRGPDEPAVRLVVVIGGRMLGPGEGDEAEVALLEQCARDGLGPFEADTQVGRQPQVHVDTWSGRLALVVAVVGVAPLRRLAAVIE